MSSTPPSNPLRDTVRWLAVHTRFPASRLEARRKRCSAWRYLRRRSEAKGTFFVQSRNGARDAALRAHNMRRSLAHYVSDNKQRSEERFNLGLWAGCPHP